MAQNEEIQTGDNDPDISSPIFDDKMLLAGYAERYQNISKEILLEMIKDDNLNSYRTAAAIRVFKEKHSAEVVYREKRVVEKILLRRLARSESQFVDVEVMHTLLRMDRYRYFKAMVPVLIQKLDHYNSNVSELAQTSLNDIVTTSPNRAREARIVFNTLRKMLFLSRKRLANMNEPTPVLKFKLELVRWSVKVLGTEELRNLPKEVLHLL